MTHASTDHEQPDEEREPASKKQKKKKSRLEIQRDFRARKATHVADLESRVTLYVLENGRLQRELDRLAQDNLACKQKLEEATAEVERLRRAERERQRHQQHPEQSRDQTYCSSSKSPPQSSGSSVSGGLRTSSSPSPTGLATGPSAPSISNEKAQHDEMPSSQLVSDVHQASLQDLPSIPSVECCNGFFACDDVATSSKGIDAATAMSTALQVHDARIQTRSQDSDQHANGTAEDFYSLFPEARP